MSSCETHLIPEMHTRLQLMHPGPLVQALLSAWIPSHCMANKPAFCRVVGAHMLPIVAGANFQQTALQNVTLHGLDMANECLALLLR